MEYKNNLRKLRTLQENNKDIKYDIEDMKEEIKNRFVIWSLCYSSWMQL